MSTRPLIGADVSSRGAFPVTYSSKEAKCSALFFCPGTWKRAFPLSLAGHVDELPGYKKKRGRRDCKVVELQVLKWQMYLQCRGGLSMPFSLSRALRLSIMQSGRPVSQLTLCRLFFHPIRSSRPVIFRCTLGSANIFLVASLFCRYAGQKRRLSGQQHSLTLKRKF